jgi:hypothetical protein
MDQFSMLSGANCRLLSAASASVFKNLSKQKSDWTDFDLSQLGPAGDGPETPFAAQPVTNVSLSRSSRPRTEPS